MKFGWQYGWSLYAKNPISRLMDDNPLIIEEGTDAQTILVDMISNHEDAVRAGYIVVEDGRFKRIETTAHLMKIRRTHAWREPSTARRTDEGGIRQPREVTVPASMSHELRTPLNAILDSPS